MKKWLIVLIVAAVIGGVWYYFRTWYRYTPIWFQPTWGEVTRGDIAVPITAAGLIEPHQRFEIKSKASGEVIERPVDEGRLVKQGDTLLVLKKDDEQRRYNSAKAELDRARALLAQAKVAVERAQANIAAADADIEKLQAQLGSHEFEYAYQKELRTRGDASERELVLIKAQFESTQAMLKSAHAQAAGARCALEDATHQVELQEAAVDVATQNLGDAKERLDDTTLLSRHDAIVTDVRVQTGEMILSGTTSLTGGTVVMYLADVSKKKVVARVDESDYGRVLRISPVDALPEMPGLRQAAAEAAAEMAARSGHVTLTVDAFPEEKFSGLIERVEPQGKLSQGSAIIQYDVHVVIDDPDAHKLPLGAQAQVEFTVESAKAALRVPADAVKSNQSQRGVWVEAKPEPGSNELWGKHFVPCRFGITDGEFTQVLEVLEGEKLDVGQRVYTKLPQNPDEAE